MELERKREKKRKEKKKTFHSKFLPTLLTMWHGEKTIRPIDQKQRIIEVNLAKLPVFFKLVLVFPKIPKKKKKKKKMLSKKNLFLDVKSINFVRFQICKIDFL